MALRSEKQKIYGQLHSRKKEEVEFSTTPLICYQPGESEELSQLSLKEKKKTATWHIFIKTQRCLQNLEKLQHFS